MASLFETFTDRLLRVFTFSLLEAQGLGHSTIALEHLLIGLMLEEKGSAGIVLKAMGVDLAQARSLAESQIGHRDELANGEVALTEGVKLAIRLAVDESRRLTHAEVDTEHLLLGLLRADEVVEDGVFSRLGKDPELIRQQQLAIFSERARIKAVKDAYAAMELEDLEEPEIGSQQLRKNLERARSGGNQERVARLEYILTRELIGALDARRDLLNEQLVSLQEQSLETEQKLAETRNRLDKLKRKRQDAVDSLRRASSRKRSSEHVDDAGEGNDAQDRP